MRDNSPRVGKAPPVVNFCHLTSGRLWHISGANPVTVDQEIEAQVGLR